MRKVEALMIEAIRDCFRDSHYNGCKLRCGNTTVTQIIHGIRHTPSFDVTIEVRLYGNKIAQFEPQSDRLTLNDCGWRTVTTKSRLNALLGAFTREPGITQRNREWVTVDGNGAAHAWPGTLTLPYTLSADNYTLRRAEELALAAKSR